MKLLLAFGSWFFICLPASATICTPTTVAERLGEAQVAFVATVTSAKAAAPVSDLRNGEDYRVDYTYSLREVIKGAPELVTSLYTVNSYRAYDSSLEFSGPETRLLPGDNVLVIASKPGPVQVAACTPSRLWVPTPELLELLKPAGRLTIRSSRTCFATPNTWQVQLAMCLAPLRKSA